MTLERGALLKNRYRIVEILGQGGMGSVYRAVDENLGVEVAVKDNLFTTEEYARQFRREAIILANLRHPNLPRVTDHFVIEGQGQYLVMDYIEGEDLRQRMDRLGTLNEDDVISIGAAVCDALTYLSSRNPSIVHRDIKPGNIKITSNGQVYLVDFGLAKIVQGSQATTTGARAMTPGYSPPEQYGTARTDQRSDVFSLGATLYAALTGIIPEDGLARAMDQADLTPLRKRNQRVSRRLAAVLERALEVRPDDRYQTATEFKQALLGARRKTGEYALPPAPGSENVILGQNSLDGGIYAPTPAGARPAGAGINGRSPLPLPVSTVVDEQEVVEPAHTRTRRRKTLHLPWVLVGILTILLVSVVGYVVWVNPNGILPLAALLRPTPTTMPASSTPTAKPTQTRQAPTTTPLPATPTIPPQMPTATLPVVIAPPASQTPTITPTPQATPMGGGGGQIAFASEVNSIYQIFLINVDGTGMRQVTDLPDGACQPSWSPDGQRMAFISPCIANQESYPGAGIFVINQDSTGLFPLQNVPGGDYDPAWSPDGRYIAFTSLRNNGRPQIYIYDLQDNTTRRLSDQFSRDMQPSWSPDGKTIAFISARRGFSPGVWLMDADGQTQRQFSQQSELIDSKPSISPDSNTILYTQMVAVRGIPRIVIAPVAENGIIEYRINQDSFPMREGVYSPDGSWIAFEGWPAGATHNIYIMAANGVGRQQVTNNPRSDFDPAWRPQRP